MLKKEDLIKLLESLSLSFEEHLHEPLFSVDESSEKRGMIEGAHTKNLFLKNKKNQFFLLSCCEDSSVDLKKFAKSLTIGNLSFAKKEYMEKYLGVLPGSVSPYALINDKSNCVSFYIEDKLYNSKKINFHPLINTSTLTTFTKSFVQFMIENNKKIHIYNLKDYNLVKSI